LTADGKPIDPLRIISEKIIRILPRARAVDTEQIRAQGMAAMAVRQSL